MAQIISFSVIKTKELSRIFWFETKNTSLFSEFFHHNDSLRSFEVIFLTNFYLFVTDYIPLQNNYICPLLQISSNKIHCWNMINKQNFICYYIWHRKTACSVESYETLKNPKLIANLIFSNLLPLFPVSLNGNKLFK